MRLIVLLVAGLSACALLRPAIDLQPCNVERVQEPLLCGSVRVPEERGNPGTKTISLKVVVVPAAGEKTLPPLYDLPGGPGMSSTAAADFWTTAGSVHRAHRDVVLVDPRGTGGSAPLDCGVRVSDPFSPVFATEIVRDCRARLSANANLAHYTTAATVADLDDVRAALGHDRIDLVGLSYGTRVAQEYVRAYPSRVRAMALLGTVSPLEKLPLSFSPNAQAVLDRLSDQCKADVQCRRNIEDLAADVAALRNTIAIGQISVTRPDGRKVALDSGPFWEAVRKQLGSTSTQRRLPWLLHQASYGKYDPILSAMAATTEQGSNGALLSVSCTEDTQRITPEDIAAISRTTFGSYRVQRQVAACRLWRVPALEDPRPGFVESEVPALLLAGEMDHATPPDWAHQVAAHLPNARVVVIPNLGHFPEGLSNFECYDRLIDQFFSAGSAKDLDTACVETMQPPPFDVPKKDADKPAKKKKPAAKKKAKAKKRAKAAKKKRARKPARPE